MPSRAKCGSKSFSKSATYRSASWYTLGREANRIAEIWSQNRACFSYRCTLELCLQKPRDWISRRDLGLVALS